MQPDMTSMANAKWDEIRGDMQRKWGRLTNSDFDMVQGSVTKLAGLIEDKYGYTADKAQREVEKFMRRYNMQDMADSAMAGIQRTARRYPWAYALGGLVLALVVVGLIWRPFDR